MEWPHSSRALAVSPFLASSSTAHPVFAPRWLVRSKASHHPYSKLGIISRELRLGPELGGTLGRVLIRAWKFTPGS